MAASNAALDEEIRDELLQQWTIEQDLLRSRIVEQDDVDNWDVSSLDGLRLVAGIDISFFADDGARAIAAISVLEFPSLEHVQTVAVNVELTQPYKPFFLAFREVPHMKHLVDVARDFFPDLLPQVVLMDGNGIYHPRRCGSASHFGVEVNMPTIGVAKSMLVLPDSEAVTEKAFRKEYREHFQQQGDTVPLKDRDGRVLGMALLASAKSRVPVYVSCGHRVSLNTATRVVTACSRHHMPEPIRSADLISRMIVKAVEGGQELDADTKVPSCQDKDGVRNYAINFEGKRVRVLHVL